MAPLVVTPGVTCAWGGWRRALRSGAATAVLGLFLLATPLAVVVRVASDHALTGTGGVAELGRSDVVTLVVALGATWAWVLGAAAALGELRGRDRPPRRSRLVPRSMQRVVTGGWRALVTGLVAAVVLAGCSGDENTLTQPGASEEPGSSAQRGAEEVAGEGFDVDDPDGEAALDDEFLLASDLHRTPDDDSAEYGSGLEELASPAVVAEADAWRSANEAHGDSYERVVSLYSEANITGIEVDGAVATIEDCTAQTSLMTTGQEITEYLTQEVRVANEGGRYRVVGLEVVHEGRLDSPGYSCVPDWMAGQAKASAETAWSGFLAAQGNPRAGLAPEVVAVLAEPLKGELVSSLADQVGEGASFTSPVDLELTPLGVDPRGLGLVVPVSVCVTYPEGLVQRELSSGDELRQVFRPGTQGEVVLAVRMNGVDGPEVFKIMSESLPGRC